MDNNTYHYLWDATMFIKDHIDLDNRARLSVIDRWIVAKCKKTIEMFLDYLQYENYEQAKETVDNFLKTDYFVYQNFVIKKIEKNNYFNKGIIAIIFVEILKMYLVFKPDVINYLYCNLYQKSEVNLLYRDNLKDIPFETNDLLVGDSIKDMILSINIYRKNNNLSAKESLNNVLLNIKNEDSRLFIESLTDLLDVINAKTVNIEFNGETKIVINDDNYKVK